MTQHNQVLVRIPEMINDVRVRFAQTVNNMIDSRLLDALYFILKPNLKQGFLLEEIYISSASDSHDWPSRHTMNKAIDISRINGKRMIRSLNNKEVYGCIQAMQQKFEGYEHRRENFGPAIKKKLGNDFQIRGHADHIHWSVN